MAIVSNNKKNKKFSNLAFTTAMGAAVLAPNLINQVSIVAHADTVDDKAVVQSVKEQKSDDKASSAIAQVLAASDEGTSDSTSNGSDSTSEGNSTSTGTPESSGATTNDGGSSNAGSDSESGSGDSSSATDDYTKGVKLVYTLRFVDQDTGKAVLSDKITIAGNSDNSKAKATDELGFINKVIPLETDGTNMSVPSGALNSSIQQVYSTIATDYKLASDSETATLTDDGNGGKNMDFAVVKTDGSSTSDGTNSDAGSNSNSSSSDSSSNTNDDKSDVRTITITKNGETVAEISSDDTIDDTKSNAQKLIDIAKDEGISDQLIQDLQDALDKADSNVKDGDTHYSEDDQNAIMSAFSTLGAAVKNQDDAYDVKTSTDDTNSDEDKNSDSDKDGNSNGDSTNNGSNNNGSSNGGSGDLGSTTSTTSTPIGMADNLAQTSAKTDNSVSVATLVGATAMGISLLGMAPIKKRV